MAGPIRTVIGGVDTHKDTHVVAALGEQGALLGTASFPTNSAGYAGCSTGSGILGQSPASGLKALVAMGPACAGSCRQRASRSARCRVRNGSGDVATEKVTRGTLSSRPSDARG